MVQTFFSTLTLVNPAMLRALNRILSILSLVNLRFLLNATPPLISLSRMYCAPVNREWSSIHSFISEHVEFSGREIGSENRECVKVKNINMYFIEYLLERDTLLIHLMFLKKFKFTRSLQKWRNRHDSNVRPPDS